MMTSPSTIPPRSSTAITRSASPSWANPTCASAATTACCSWAGCVAPQPTLMRAPSASACRRADPVGRPKGAVHDDAQAGRRAQAQAEEVVQVEVLRLRQVANAAHLRAGRGRAVRPGGGLEAVLHIIRKLE